MRIMTITHWMILFVLSFLCCGCVFSIETPDFSINPDGDIDLDINGDTDIDLDDDDDSDGDDDSDSSDDDDDTDDTIAPNRPEVVDVLARKNGPAGSSQSWLIRWHHVRDNRGVVGLEVYVDDELAATLPDPQQHCARFADCERTLPLSAIDHEHPHVIRIRAVDAASNRSAASRPYHTRVFDFVAPSAPKVSALAVAPDLNAPNAQWRFEWFLSDDNTEVKVYDIFVDGGYFDLLTDWEEDYIIGSLSFNLAKLDPRSDHLVELRARDQQFNRSKLSQPYQYTFGKTPHPAGQGPIVDDCFPGDFVIETEAHIEMLNQYDCVDGQLRIAAPRLTQVALPRLKWVRDELSVINCHKLGRLALPVLASIGGLQITSNTNLATVGDLGQLKVVDGDVEIAQNEYLEDLGDLSSLSYVNGAVSLAQNPSLKNVEGLRRLKCVESELSLVDNRSLSDIEGLRDLAITGGPVRIAKNDQLRRIDGLRNLKVIAGRDGLQIEKNRALINLRGLGELRAVGRVRIAGNDQLTSLGGLASLRAVDWASEISSNASLPNCNICQLKARINDLPYRLYVHGNLADDCGDETELECP